MSKDFADFLDSLNKEGVAYVVIGGIAVLSYIPFRTTRDLDILIEPTLENAQKAHRAVWRWGGFEPEFPPEDFISGDILSFGGLLRVEIHSRLPGVAWNEVWQHRVTGSIFGISTHFPAIKDLIAMKRATADPVKDLPDVQRLTALARERGEDPD